MRLIQCRKPKLFEVCISGVPHIVHRAQVTRKVIIKITSDTDYKIYFWASSAISFITKLPKELDFHKIIDYNVQFEKSFVEPLKFITDKILWRIDDSYGTQGTLEDFFT